MISVLYATDNAFLATVPDKVGIWQLSKPFGILEKSILKAAKKRGEISAEQYKKLTAK